MARKITNKMHPLKRWANSSNKIYSKSPIQTQQSIDSSARSSITWEFFFFIFSNFFHLFLSKYHPKIAFYNFLNFFFSRDWKTWITLFKKNRFWNTYLTLNLIATLPKVSDFYHIDDIIFEINELNLFFSFFPH